MAVMQQVVLSSGRRMPVLGMGTATYPVPPDEIMTSAVIDAIVLGYRHFDTASIYGSERAVGQAIATALERGLIRSRDELFVTTKLWCTDMHADRVVPALRQCLDNGAIGVFWGSNDVLECEEVKRIAQSTGKSRAQVCLRWGVEQGGSIVVKSFNKERLKENMEIFDWHLKEEDKERLSLVPQKRLILVHPFISPNGLYKSHAEFWDGDV